MKTLLAALCAFFVFCSVGFIEPQSHSYWVRFCDRDQNCGYVNANGDTMIKAGKYLMFETDTFRLYAKVLQNHGDWIGIDKNEKILYKIHWFDNGPDHASEGLFRIWKNGKMGYADERTGKIILYPQYGAGFPFENGKAKVSPGPCISKADEQTGEYHYWVCDEWFYIDHSGKKVDPPKTISNPHLFVHSLHLSVLLFRFATLSFTL